MFCNKYVDVKKKSNKFDIKTLPHLGTLIWELCVCVCVGGWHTFANKHSPSLTSSNASGHQNCMNSSKVEVIQSAE